MSGLKVGDCRLSHHNGFTDKVVANRIAFPLQRGLGLGRVGHLGLVVTKDVGGSGQGYTHHAEF